MSIELTSDVFSEGEMIPSEFTCDGEDISPPLRWKNLPEGTKSIAIVSDDPDAPSGTWVHWVIYNIPADKQGLQQDFPTDEKLQDGTTQGKNDFGRTGYGGPCPPGGTHRYYFRIYALDTDPLLKPGLTKKELLENIKSHIIDEGELMGRYSR